MESQQADLAVSPIMFRDPWSLVRLLASTGHPKEVSVQLGHDVPDEQLREAVDEVRSLVDEAESVMAEAARIREWVKALSAAAKYTRLTRIPLSDALIEFALAVVHARPYTYVAPGGAEFLAPPGAPERPFDWAVWAHRVLDTPLTWRTAPDGKGRTHRVYRDPWSVAMTTEDERFLAPSRRWDAQVSGWR